MSEEQFRVVRHVILLHTPKKLMNNHPTRSCVATKRAQENCQQNMPIAQQGKLGGLGQYREEPTNPGQLLPVETLQAKAHEIVLFYFLVAFHSLRFDIVAFWLVSSMSTSRVPFNWFLFSFPCLAFPW